MDPITRAHIENQLNEKIDKNEVLDISTGEVQSLEEFQEEVEEYSRSHYDNVMEFLQEHGDETS